MIKRASCFILVLLLFCSPLLAKKQHKNHFINYTYNALGNSALAFMIGWHAEDISTDNDEFGSQFVPIMLTTGLSVLALVKMKRAFDKNIQKERSNFLSLMNASADMGLITGSLVLNGQPLLSLSCIGGYLAKYALFNRPKK